MKSNQDRPSEEKSKNRRCARPRKPKSAAAKKNAPTIYAAIMQAESAESVNAIPDTFLQYSSLRNFSENRHGAMVSGRREHATPNLPTDENVCPPSGIAIPMKRSG